MKAVIVGGGIIGLNTAYFLRQSGWEVSIVDQGDFTNNCSYGNLGMVVPSHFVPLAMPGMIAQGIRWMFNNKSPFYVRPGLNPGLINWGLKFMKAANASHVARAANPLREINLLSKSLYEDFNQLPGFDFGFEKKGIIMYYKTELVAEDENKLAGKARDMGLDAFTLNRQELLALEPEAKPDVLGGVHYRCDAHLTPDTFMVQLINHLKSAGVNFFPEQKITKILKKGKRITGLCTDSNTYLADLFVFAAGSWLPELTKKAGLSIPLMPGKGYSFTNTAYAGKLNIPAILCEARVAITPMDNQLRFGGTMEIGPVNNQIKLNRVAGIVESVPAYFPGITLPMPKQEEVWYGFRPCSPDGLPYIGRPKKFDNLLIGGGHAMMGLSLGPATGKLLTQLANDQTPAMNLEIFSPDRF